MAKKKKVQDKDSGLIGRRHILKKIHQEIEKQEPAIVLKGPAGVGKSFILTRVIDDLKKKKYDILMIRGLTSAEMVLKKIAQKAAEKGIKEAEGIFASPVEYKEKLKKLLENFIYKKKLLLVFEDFDENQTTEGEFLNERLKELILYLKDELKEKDSLMIFSTRDEIPKFTPIEIEPFTWLEFLKLISRTFTLKRLKEKALKSFYFEMGGFPRAVELFDIIAHHEFGTAHFDWPGLRERVPTLRERILHKDSETADFSYLLIEALLGYLKENQRQLLNTICIYRGPVAQEALNVQHREIKPGDRKKLEKLSLINYLPRQGLYHVHRLTAQVVRSRLEENEQKQKHLAAAKYFQGLCPKADPVSGAANEDRPGQEYDENGLEARWHYIEAGDIDTAMSMTFGMDYYFSRIGFPQFAFDLVREMERYASETTGEQQIHLRLRLGTFYSIFGKLDDALTQHEACLKLHESRQDTRGIALNLGQMGLIYEAKGKYDEALEKYQKSLQAYEKINDPVEIARRLDQIGSILKRQGNYDEAFEKYQRALKINRELNNQKEISANLEQLGRIHDEQGKFDAALDYYKESLAIKETIDDKPGIASIVHQRGNVYFVKGNLDEAFSQYQRSLKIKQEIKDHKGAGYSLGQIGLIYQRKGKTDEALKQFTKSLKNFEKADEQKGIAASHHQIGRIYENKGDREKALTHYEKALELREKLGDMLGAAITYGQLGMLYYQKEEYETALRYSTQAFAVFSRYGSPNAELARKNMLRIRDKLPQEKFNQILNEFNIKTGPQSPQKTGKEGGKKKKKPKPKTKKKKKDI
ncbi:MAG: tetratricopeptide repeat protein [Candidatus Aminicenantes bacterium]|nr:MAG: tetratricopeptide repeat protein [Candidatus Aminicenantes bacterium]